MRINGVCALGLAVLSGGAHAQSVCMPSGMSVPPAVSGVVNQTATVSCMRPAVTAIGAMTSSGIQLGAGNACPAGSGWRNLSSTHPPAGVVVTYDGSNRDYVTRLAEIIRTRQPGLPLNILVDSTAVASMDDGSSWSEGSDQSRLNAAASDLSGLLSTAAAAGQQINLIPVSVAAGTTDPTALWAQDLANFDGVVGTNSPLPQNSIFDLPYGRADNVPAQVGAACNIGVTTTGVSSASAFSTGPNDDGDRSGNMGGDIEGFPGNTLVVGQNIEPRLRDELGRQMGVRTSGASGGLVQVNTNWLNVGHVDEIFNVVPTNGPGPCNFAILYSDPDLGMQLAQRAADGTGTVCRGSPLPAGCAEIEPPLGGPAGTGGDDAGGCLSALPHAAYATPRAAAGQLTARAALGCQRFRDANAAYAAGIRADLRRIQAQVAARAGCGSADSVRTVGLPTLYRPTQSQAHWGRSGDAADAVNPNPVNGLVLNNTMVVPQQSNPEFARVVTDRLTAVGIHPEYIDDRVYHFNLGEVHCSSNAFRTCAP